MNYQAKSPIKGLGPMHQKNNLGKRLSNHGYQLMLDKVVYSSEQCSHVEKQRLHEKPIALKTDFPQLIYWQTGIPGQCV